VSASPKTAPPEIKNFFKQFEDLLLQTWQETGFGHLEVDSERINNDKIRVIIRGSTHYRYVIRENDVNQWLSR